MTLQVNQVIRSLAEAIPSNSVKIAQVAKSRHLQIIHLPFVCGEMCLKAVSVTDDFHQSRLSSFRLMFQTQAKFVCVCVCLWFCPTSQAVGFGAASQRALHTIFCVLVGQAQSEGTKPNKHVLNGTCRKVLQILRWGFENTSDKGPMSN